MESNYKCSEYCKFLENYNHNFCCFLTAESGDIRYDHEERVFYLDDKIHHLDYSTKMIILCLMENIQELKNSIETLQKE
jgi:hypothetical protein